jgi:uncharacterized protein
MSSSSQAPTHAPVSRIARRRALADKEAEYEALVREMFVQMRGTPGFISADLLPPEQVGDEYQVIVHFASEAALQEWDKSSARSAIHARMRSVAESEPEYRRLSGLEAWFTSAVVPASMHPPRLRMAIVTWVGIFPTVSFVLWFIAPLMQSMPFLLRTALLTILVVVTMTWIVMPRLTKLLRGWLSPAIKK